MTLENDRLRVLVVVDKGADLLELLYKPLDLELLWRSYHGLRWAGPDRASSPLAAGPFREQFAGGWYEMLPNGPESSVHRGAAFGFHGEATLLPWDYRIAVDDPDRIVVTFSVRLVRMPIHVEKTLTLWNRETSADVTAQAPPQPSSRRCDCRSHPDTSRHRNRR